MKRASGGRAPEPGGETHAPEARILFVCTGNTCRSPMAEGIARTGAARRGWPRIRVRSAGSGAAAGLEAAREARQVTATHGIELSAHRSRPLTQDDIEWADLVVGMSDGHLSDVEALGGARRLELMTSFLPEDDIRRNLPVPDPVGASREIYAETYLLLEACIEGLLDALDAGNTPREGDLEGR